jgi:hypothetical protein
VLLPLIGLLVVVGGAVGALVLLTGGQEDGPDITEVFAEPVASTGIDPFTPTLVPQSFDIPLGDDGTIASIVNLLNPPVGSLSEIDFPDFDFPGIDIPQPTLGGADPTDVVDAVVTTVSGAAPGLYGGTEILNSCNRDALIGFMTENLDKATAWAGVQGIDVNDIPNFIGSLTDVILQVDTRVVNHGFRGGAANPINSVLQAGTAVLVDTFGIPRVRCYCGNPLAPAIALATDVTVLGNPWAGFDLGSAVVIQAIEEVLAFDLEDILGPLRFVKRVGSVVTTPATPSTTSTVPTTTTTIELGTGDVQATLRWTGDADLDLHVIDPEGFEIFFFNARSPSGGELDVDMQPACGTSANNVENVFWPEGGSIPGEYQVFVVHFADTLCSQPGTYVLELKIDGVVVASDSGTLGVGEQSVSISATGG